MSDRQLYSVAIEHLNPKTGLVVDTAIFQIHASSQREAEINARAANTQAIVSGRMRIVSVGLTVGFFGEETQDGKDIIIRA